MRKLISTTIILFAVLVSGCGESETVSDKGEGLRIISIAPSNTEILFGLGLDKEIVGVTTYCDYPLQALSKEKVGNFSNPSIEKIVQLKPDIIFGTGIEQSNTIKRLKALKLNVYEINPENLLEVYEAIELIGKLTNRSTQADIMIKDMKSRIDSIRKKVALQDKKPGIFIEISSKPLMTASYGSFIDEITSIVGENIVGKLPRPFCRINEEFIIDRNPDIIILTSTITKEKFLSQHSLGDVSAVKNNRVYDDIVPDILVRSSQRLAEGLEALYSRCYEEK